MDLGERVDRICTGKVRAEGLADASRSSAGRCALEEQQDELGVGSMATNPIDLVISMTNKIITVHKIVLYFFVFGAGGATDRGEVRHRERNRWTVGGEGEERKTKTCEG
ncbi:unnamed protein product [Urochloa humidicola]